MYYYIEDLINPIVPDEPDPAAAKALQEVLGGQFGEMRTMNQFLFQSFNFRGNAKPFRDLIRSIAIEEISHVELVATTINSMLHGSTPGASNGHVRNGHTQATGTEPMEESLGLGLVQEYLVGGQGSLPVDSAGNPFNGTWVYSSGSLIHDLIDNLHLEATGRLWKSRIYEMSSNKTMRETLAFLIVRDSAHQIAFAKALETLGVNWGKLLPVPDLDLDKFPECRKYVEKGLHNKLFNFRQDAHQTGVIFQGPSPHRAGGSLSVEPPPEGFPVPMAPEVPEAFSPGLPRSVQEDLDRNLGPVNQPVN